MKQYLDLLEYTLANGEGRPDRTGTGVVGVFAPPPMVFDLQLGYPLVTVRKIKFETVVRELLWFLRGDTDIGYLLEHDVHIWDKWANDHGRIGPMYGKQWRAWDAGYTDQQIDDPDQTGAKTWVRTHHAIDQVWTIINTLRADPFSRRHVVTAWNVADLDKMVLHPCHGTFQCYVRAGTYLDMQVYQRSADLVIGVPFNIASYALLLHMLADQTGHKPGKLTHVLGDAHIYENHIGAARLLLRRKPRPLPRLTIPYPVVDIDSYELESFKLEGYAPHRGMKLGVAV